MDNHKNILKIQNIKNDIKLGQFCLFSNYTINKGTNEIVLNKNSFSYFSNQELYFSSKINLNTYSVIKFYFLDYKSEGNNIYNAIKVDKETKNITANEMVFILKNKKIKNYELLVKSITLLKEYYLIDGPNFEVSFIQGFINKVNAFINYKSEFSYYYEYLYYYYNEFDFLRSKAIKIFDINYNILIYDNFCSKNRTKFNILNIPFQNECENEALNKVNSLLICETFYESPKKSKIFGIFNIEEIKYNIPIIQMNNNVFNIYYNDFGFIYDYLKKNQNNKEEIDSFINKCEITFNTYINKLKLLYFKSNLHYEDIISPSQLKTRIGIISSYYLSIPNSKKEKTKIFRQLKSIIADIIDNENYLSKEQILRLFIILTRRILEKGANPNLVFLSDLNEEYSPYFLAYKFNLEEIRNINEYSRLFSGYLQMDSHILYNYNNLIKNKSYSFSLEPLFVLKYHLISNYEGFFLTEMHNNDVLAWTEVDVRITIINITNLFQKSKVRDISIIHDNKVLKDHAFGISVVFRHEKKSHQKKNLKNSKIISPFYYCDNGDIKVIKFEGEKNVFTGEDGILIESLIIEDQEVIMSLAKDFIYGELLDYRLFISKDFVELKNKIHIIKEKNKEYFNIFKLNNYNLKSNERNEMKELTNNIKSNIPKEKIMEILKQKELRLGDQTYSLNLIKNIISLEKMKNQYHLLPPIFIEIDKELKKNEENN